MTKPNDAKLYVEFVYLIQYIVSMLIVCYSICIITSAKDIL